MCRISSVCVCVMRFHLVAVNESFACVILYALQVGASARRTDGVHREELLPSLSNTANLFK